MQCQRDQGSGSAPHRGADCRCHHAEALENLWRLSRLCHRNATRRVSPKVVRVPAEARRLVPATRRCSLASVLPASTPLKAIVFEFADFLKSGIVMNIVAVVLGIPVTMEWEAPGTSNIVPVTFLPSSSSSTLPEQSSSRDVFFGVPGRVFQDVSLVMCD